MSAQITSFVFYLGAVLLVVFVVVGLASSGLRRRLQEPADQMVVADRQRWGAPAAQPTDRTTVGSQDQEDEQR